MALGFRSRSCRTESMETSGDAVAISGGAALIQTPPASLAHRWAHGAYARGPTGVNSSDADFARSRRATCASQGNSEMIRTLTPARTPAAEAGARAGDEQV